MATSNSLTASERGRHVASGAALVAGVVFCVATWSGGIGFLTGDPCADTRTLRVSAAPEVAPAIDSVAKSVRGLGCTDIEVTVADPAEAVASLEGTSFADVWIPDSSVWLADLRKAGGTLVDKPTSIAFSPVVLAVSAHVARRVGPGATYEQIGATMNGADPLEVSLPDPETSALSRAALIDLASSLGGTPTGRGQFAGLVRAMCVRPSTAPLPRAGVDAAVVTTESAVATAGPPGPHNVYRAVHPVGSGTAMNYPYVVLSHDAEIIRAARLLRDELTRPDGRWALERMGLRTQRSGPFTRVPTTAESRAAMRTFSVLKRATRALAVFDVSGSMGTRLLTVARR